MLSNETMKTYRPGEVFEDVSEMLKVRLIARMRE
jgi:hypothetical protein